MCQLRHRVAIQKVAKGVSLGVAVASSIMLNPGAVAMGATMGCGDGKGVPRIRSTDQHTQIYLFG